MFKHSILRNETGTGCANAVLKGHSASRAENKPINKRTDSVQEAFLSPGAIHAASS
jgi:hypothetical protein